jgi:hypothetical protein
MILPTTRAAEVIDRDLIPMVPGNPARTDYPSRSAVTRRARARGRRPTFEEIEGRMLPSGGLRGLVPDESHRMLAAARKAGHQVARPATPPPPALPARLAGPPDSNGNIVVIGRATPGTIVRLDIGADGTSEGRVRANAGGVFRLTFHVGYGTTPVQLVALGPGRRRPVADLSVSRPDTQPPTLEVLSPSPGALASSDVTIAGQVADGQSGVGMLTARLDGGLSVALAYDGAGRFAYTVPLPTDGTADGPHVAQLEAVSRAGNQVTTANVSFTLDTIGPTLTLLSPSSGLVTQDAPTIPGRVADLVSGVGTLTARLDQGSPVPVAVAPDGSFSYTPQLPLDGTANGPHVVQFLATDRAGNSSAPAALTFTLDATPKANHGVVLTILDQPSQPVLTQGDPGTGENKYGFEGGTVVQLNGLYYLFTSEMFSDRFSVKMRLALWTSPDGTSWTRVSTLYESSGTSDGSDPRAALWSPMPIFDDAANRWDLFYVAYRSLPDTPQEFLGNYDGEIWRAVSTQPGLAGIEGPYQDVGVVLQPGSDSGAWEGLQGTDSFYPYRVGDRWYAFYGSANPVQPNPYWEVGLATAPDLAGPWVRLPEPSPVPLDPRNGVENPIVTRLASGQYIAVFDALGYTDRIGYTVSTDGINWSPAQYLELDPSKLWTGVVRTPLGLIPEADGTFTLFYTGYYDKPGYGVYSGLGVLKLGIGRASQGNPASYGLSE